jgi:putative transposase
MIPDLTRLAHYLQQNQAAYQFCQAFDELRNYLRARQRMKQANALAEQRRMHLERMGNLKGMLQAA